MKMLLRTSTLADGPTGRNVDLSAIGEENRRKFLIKHFGERILPAVSAKNVHGSNVCFVNAENAGEIIDDCDGLITQTPNLPLMIGHQDCVPIAISDESSSFVCLLHAGWRGVVRGILSKAIDMIRKDFSQERLGFYFGPGIGPCHFEVKGDVAEQFRSISTDSVIERDGKLFADMHAALTAQATGKGIDVIQIVMSHDCTYHNEAYASWRRDGIRENNMITVAMLTE